MSLRSLSFALPLSAFGSLVFFIDSSAIANDSLHHRFECGCLHTVNTFAKNIHSYSGRSPRQLSQRSLISSLHRIASVKQKIFDCASSHLRKLHGMWSIINQHKKYDMYLNAMRDESVEKEEKKQFSISAR